jgi:hypothetical protein
MEKIKSVAVHKESDKKWVLTVETDEKEIVLELSSTEEIQDALTKIYDVYESEIY